MNLANHARAFVVPVAVAGFGLMLSPLASAQLGPRQTFPFPGQPIHAIDMDGDLDQDLVVRSNDASGTARLDWVENLGGGQFGSVRPIATPAIEPTQYIDIDGDGDLDYFREVWSGQPIWWENVGAGLAGPARSFPTISPSFSQTIGDVDGDGDADMIAALWATDELVLYENQGGTFTGPSVVGTTSPFPHQVVAVDVDTDGDLDLAWVADFLVTSTEDVVRWHANDGTGQFTFSSSDISSGALDEIERVQFEDLDGDGDLDALIRAPGGLEVYAQNEGNGSFTGSALSAADALIANPAVGFVDLDGDGDKDLVYEASAQGPALRWRQQTGGSPPFAASQLLAVSGLPTDIQQLLGFDFDGDGDGELIVNPTGPRDSGWHDGRFLGDVGEFICDPAVPNSTGQPGAMAATGNIRRTANDLTLTSTSLPAHSFGFFLTSPLQAFIPISGPGQGFLCLGGSIGRYVGAGQIQNSGAMGSIQLILDLGMMPTPMGAVSASAGETWWFQAWYRDASPIVTSNFTSAVGVTFF